MRSAVGSVEELEKGKYYRVRVELPRDEVTGKRRQITRRVRGSRKDAEALKIKLLNEVSGGDIAPSNVTLGDFFREIYLPVARINLRPRTVQGYESTYRSTLSRLDDKALGDISPFMVQQLMATMAPKRALEARRLLRLLLNKAVALQLLNRNPVLAIEAPKVDRYRPEVLTLEEFSVYAEAIRGSDIEPALLVILGCGTTRSETIALNWVDITQAGAVTIDNAITELHGRPHEDRPKNEFRVRTVHLPASFAARLNELRPACEYMREGLDIVPRPLTTLGGVGWVERMRPDVLSGHYEKLRDTLPPGVKRISLKNLRHTSLSLAIEAGVDLLAVSRRAGHSGTAITARYYLRPSDSIDVAAASKLDAYISPAGGHIRTQPTEDKTETEADLRALHT